MEERKVGKIYESLQGVNDDLKAIGKDSQGFGYKFRGIDDVYNAVGPLLKKHGIVTRRCVLDVIPIPTEVTKNAKGAEIKMNHFLVKCNYSFVSTKDGSEFLTWGTGEGQDKSDKGVACALSNAYKYVIWELFNIATEELQDSDMKTAKENKVEAPAKKVAPEVNKSASFRNKKVVEPAKSGEL